MNTHSLSHTFGRAEAAIDVWGKRYFNISDDDKSHNHKPLTLREMLDETTAMTERVMTKTTTKTTTTDEAVLQGERAEIVASVKMQERE